MILVNTPATLTAAALVHDFLFFHVVQFAEPDFLNRAVIIDEDQGRGAANLQLVKIDAHDFIHVNTLRFQICLCLLLRLRKKRNCACVNISAILHELFIKPDALFAEMTGSGEN